MSGREMGEGSKGQPELSPGQVWRPRLPPRAPVTVWRVDGGTLHWTHGGWDRTENVGRFYECIGIETPAGRVMVGERRRSNGGDYTVLRVVDGDTVEIEWGPGDDGLMSTDVAAMWPLVPEAAKDTRSTEEVLRAWGYNIGQAAKHSGVGRMPMPECAHIFDRAALHAFGRAIMAATVACIEGGPGIAALAISPPVARPDVVFTWEAWALP